MSSEFRDVVRLRVKLRGAVLPLASLGGLGVTTETRAGRNDGTEIGRCCFHRTEVRVLAACED